MATVRLISLHAGSGGGGGNPVAAALGRTTDYIENGEKTNGGELVFTYECDPLTAPQEFLLAKREYAIRTGRSQGARDVIAYHLRQSFKPGECDAETAGKIARETVMALTKGKHAFIIAVHVDKAHIHTHTVFNSTNLDCNKKFRDFKRSGLALQKISDTICLQHGLSIIENPQEKGKSYDKWLGNAKPLSNREQLMFVIDSVLPKCKTWADFIRELELLGCIVKQGAHVSVKLPDAKRFARLSSLPDGYDENSIRSRLSGTLKFEPKPLRETNAKAPQLLIDIQAKLVEGKGAGYEHWAHIFNIKQMSKTLVFLKELGIESYDELVAKQSEASGKFHAVSNRIKEIENRQSQIAELQKQIGAYGKTRDVYARYKSSGFNQDFYENHRAAITLHNAAKKYFDEHKELQNNGKLPSIDALKEEWGKLESEKRKLYSQYHAEKKDYTELTTALSNARTTLGIDQSQHNQRDYGAR
jgi:hypothetical protein